MQQVLDISGEAASLAEIRYYAERFFENMPSAIIIVDNSGLVTNFNEIAVDITEIEKDQIIGRNIKDIKNSGIANIKELLIDGIDKQKIYKKHIIKIRNTTNQEIPIMINISIQRDINDNLIGVIGAFRKVEEIKQFEESIVRAKNLESLGTMSAGMAHEIRNPLTSIKGYAQFIKSELGENSDLIPDIIVILNEVDRLNGIVDRFLSFARPQQLEMELGCVNDIVRDVIKLSSKEIQNNKIRILEKYNEIPLILIDIEQMEQALLNIILNSIQAMQDGGILRISTFYDNVSDFIEVSIADTGCGIPLEYFDKVFEPFFTTKNKGTGLGLPISSRIIDNHKGFIEVTSIPGKGTKFTIKLPIKK
jgi:PAS domain S-box-containing protein